MKQNVQTRGVRHFKASERAETRGAAQLSVREITAHGFDCAHCSRDFLVIAGDVVSVKSPHGDEVHANAVTVSALMRSYIPRASRGELNELRRMIDERLK